MKKVIFFVSLVVFILLYNVFICQTMNIITTITDDVDFNSSEDIYIDTLIGGAICVGVYIFFRILSSIAKSRDDSFLNILSKILCIMLGAAFPSIVGLLFMDDIRPCDNFIVRTHNQYSSLCDKNGNTIIENEDYTLGNVKYYIGDIDRWHEKVILQIGLEGENAEDNYILKIRVYDYKTYKLLEVGKLFVSHNDYDEDTLTEILVNDWDYGKYKDIYGYLDIGNKLCYMDYEEIYTNYDDNNENDNETRNESKDYEEDNNDDNRPSPPVAGPRQLQPVQVWVKCPSCYASRAGKCGICGGDGRNPYYSGDRYVECVGCGGDGRCGACGGSGGHYETQYR